MAEGTPKDPTQELDLELVRRVQRGDSAAFDLLVRKYQHRITGLIGRYIADWSECQDVAQETFMRAYRALGNFRGDAQFYTWLHRIAVNTAKNHLVAHNRRPPTDDIDASDAEQYEAGARLRVIAGRAYGEESPVKVFSGTFNVAVDLQPDAELEIDAGHVERALYVLEGDAQVDGADIPEKHLVVFDRGSRPVLRAKTPVKGLLMGGEPLDAPRHMWWNFVSSSQERIDQAKQDWLAGHFGQVPGETEFIPLPER